jgi:hypothetical protein
VERLKSDNGGEDLQDRGTSQPLRTGSEQKRWKKEKRKREMVKGRRWVGAAAAAPAQPPVPARWATRGKALGVCSPPGSPHRATRESKRPLLLLVIYL